MSAPQAMLDYSMPQTFIISCVLHFFFFIFRLDTIHQLALANKTLHDRHSPGGNTASQYISFTKADLDSVNNPIDRPFPIKIFYISVFFFFFPLNQVKELNLCFLETVLHTPPLFFLLVAIS